MNNLSRITNASTREEAMEIALLAASGYIWVWRDDVTFRQLPYREGIVLCGEIIRAALEWQDHGTRPLAEAIAAE